MDEGTETRHVLATAHTGADVDAVIAEYRAQGWSVERGPAGPGHTHRLTLTRPRAFVTGA